MQINRRITFARKQAGIFGVSGLANGMKGVGRRARETSEKRRARILMEDQGLKEEFGRAVCGDGGMSPHAFVDPTWVVVDGDDTAGVWNVMCSAFDRSNEVKRSMASAALGVCLEMHMPSVLGMLSSRAESGKDVIPLEWRRSAVRAHALSLCRSLHVWFGGCEAMDSAVRYLSWFGDMDDPCTVEAALSDRDRYVDLMRSTTVKGSSGEEGQAISWPDGCPMKRVGGMVELARMP